MGHAGGMSITDIHPNVVSPFVTGEIPCNHSRSNIFVQIQRPNYAVGLAKTFYIGVKDKDTLAVALSPRNIIPRRGFLKLVPRS